MSLPAAVAVAGALLGVAFAFAALFHGRQSVAYRAFAAGLAALAAEQVVSAVLFESPAERAGGWLRARFLATGFVPGPLLMFALTFARRDPRRFLARRGVIAAAFVFPVAAAWPGAPLSHGLRAGATGHAYGLTAVGMAFHLAVLLGFVVVLVELERTLRAASGTMRWQIKFFALGLGALLAARIYTTSQMLLFRSADVSLLLVDSIALVVALGVMSAGAVRTRLQDLDVYLSPTMVYRSVAALLVGVYLLAVGALAQVSRDLGGARGLPLAALVVLLALVGIALPMLSENLRRSLRRFVSRHLRRPQYDYRREWMAFTDRTSAVMSLDVLGRVVVHVVADTLGVPSVTLWLCDDGPPGARSGGSTVFTDEQARALVRAEPGSEELSALLSGSCEPCDVRRPGPALSRALARAPAGYLREARYAVGLGSGDASPGFLTLSERGTGEPLSTEDLDLLRTLARQAAASIQNVRLGHRLVKAKEMEAFQHVSAFFIHDLKNLASRLSLTLQNAPRHLDDPAFRKDMLETMSLTVAEIEQTCSRLWPLSGRVELRRRCASLDELVSTTVSGLNGSLGAAVKQDLGHVDAVRMDPEQIQKVLVNLLLNANDAAGPGGSIQVATGERGGCALLTVSDDGCGMSGEFVARSLFEPFCTTKRRGLGIGLFHARKIVEAHDGRIEVESVEGGGSTFRVVLPAGAP